MGVNQETARRLLDLTVEYQRSVDARADWGVQVDNPVGRDPEQIAEDVAGLLSRS